MRKLLRNNGYPKTIKHVAIDKSAVYAISVSDSLWDVQLVDGKFHLIKNVVVAYYQIRIAQSRAGACKRDSLEGTRWIWPKNWANWKGKEAQNSELKALERFVRAWPTRCGWYFKAATSGEGM